MRKFIVGLLLVLILTPVVFSRGVPEEETYTLSFGHVLEEDHAYHLMALRFKEELESMSDGRVTVEIYPARQLGDERDLVEGLQLGTVDVSTITSALTAGFVPEFGVFSLPFLFRDFDHLFAVMDSPFGDDLEEALAREGLIKLGFVSGGSRSMYASKPVETLDDLQGMSIRTMEDPIYIDTWNALGALATPIPWSDVYLSLDQGIVDGAEGALISYKSMGFYDPSPHVTVINYIFSWHNFMMSAQTWNELPADIQEMVKDAAEIAGQWEREYVKNLELELIDTLEREHGVIVHYPEDIDRWRNSVRDIYEKRAADLGGMELIETIIATE